MFCLRCARWCACGLVGAWFAASAISQTVKVVDPLAVRAEGDAAHTVVTVSIPRSVPVQACDVVVVGGELGGTAAALEAARRGARVCITEPTNWVGGQMTAQGVAAFDDNQWTETSGGARTFLQLRETIRRHYAPMLRADAKTDAHFNPGSCWVSYECFEATVGYAALRSMLEPYIANGRLKLLTRTAPVSAERKGSALKSVAVYNFETHKLLRLTGTVFIDATSLGQFLPMAGAEYVTGAEARGETGEPEAPLLANPNAGQSFTYPFVLIERTGATSDERPSSYEKDRAHFSFDSKDASGLTLRYGMFAQFDKTPGSFWSYRRLVDKSQFQPGAFASDLSMINWDSNDVCDDGLLSLDAEQQARALQHGKRVALEFAWWLRHEAPRDDNQGVGYPEVGIAGAAMGSDDGLSLFPYVRESRRIKARRTIREQDVATKEARGAWFSDTVGIGYYPLDIHACGPDTLLPESKPAQIPLGSLLSSNIDNLMAASKNIGTTHITNGSYRVHPTEWAIGDAAGALAARAVKARLGIKQIADDPRELLKLQKSLIESGQPLVWFDDVPVNSAHFQGVQIAALLGLIELSNNSLSYHPEAPLTGRELSFALGKLHRNEASGAADAPVYWEMLRKIAPVAAGKSGVVTRGEFADWLVEVDHSSTSISGPPRMKL